MNEYEDTAPEVTWAMPADAPSHVDVARRNEYHTDRMTRAGKIVRLVFLEYDVPPSADETAREIAALEQTLAAGAPDEDAGFLEQVRWQALCIMNIPKIESSSSAARERNARS